MELVKKAEQIMRQAIENSEVMGVNLLVERDGKEICYCETGMADREAGRPLTRDTIFRLYSQTKPVTAAAAMILMERGVVDLCQPVSDFLPAYEKLTVDCNGEIKPCKLQMRVHDLLRMTSGLVYPDLNTLSGRAATAVFVEADRRLLHENAMTTRELADALATCPLDFEPGTSWRYGTSADVLGAVIEAASGMRFGEFLQKEIFEPLGMKDTAFWVPTEKRDRLAAVYKTVIRKDGTGSMARYEENNLAIRNDMAESPAYEAGGAGLVSTLDDYMRFARMLLQGGELDGVRILQPGTVEFMTKGRLMDNQQKVFEQWIGLDGFSYGNLMRTCKDPDKAGFFAKEGEYGWDGWLGMYFANFPKEKLTILMGTQKTDAGTFALTRKLRNAVLSSL